MNTEKITMAKKRQQQKQIQRI